MLLGGLPSLSQLPGLLLVLISALLVGITIHEFSHALLASGLGDSTARRLGRVSLNPLAHLDPAGTVMILLVGFGWGKPVPVNPAYLRNGVQGMALVSLAGPLSNVLMASILGIPFRLGWLPFLGLRIPDVFGEAPEAILAQILFFVIFINLILAMFNLIPLAPLDGFKVALGLLPREAAAGFSRLEPYGPVILIGVILLDFGLDVGILSRIIFPPVQFFARLILGF